MMIRTWLVLVLWAEAASAQQRLGPPKVREIDIQIDDGCTIRPKEISLVLNDRVVKTAELQSDGHWRWTVLDTEAIDYGVPKDAQIGIRFDGGRTRCRHHNTFLANPKNIGVASFSFPRCITGLDVTLQVTFERRGEAPYRINYVRKVNKDEGDDLSHPCRERLDFPVAEPYDFLGFANSVDDLSIYLYKPTRDPEGKLVPLNPLLKGKRLAKGEQVGPDKVAFLWAEKELKERANLAPNEIAIDATTLDDIHFKSLKLTFRQKK